MKTCPNCQSPVNDDDLFCPNCGSKVEAAQNMQEAASSNPYLQTTNPYAQPAAEANPAADPFAQPAADVNAGADPFAQPAAEANTQTNPYQQYQQPNQQYQQPNQQYQQPTGNYYAQPQQPVNHGINTTPILIWSILNLLFCCMPLGVWSLILTTTLNKKPTFEEAQKSYKTAKTICIIGTVLGALVQIGYLVFVFITAFLQSMSSY